MKRKNQTKISEAIEFFFYSLGLNEIIYEFEVKKIWEKLVSNYLISNTSKIIVKKKSYNLFKFNIINYRL